jgi:hypothetical protein
MDKKKRRERERERGQRSMLIGILFVVINLLLNCGSELYFSFFWLHDSCYLEIRFGCK